LIGNSILPWSLNSNFGVIVLPGKGNGIVGMTKEIATGENIDNNGYTERDEPVFCLYM